MYNKIEQLLEFSISAVQEGPLLEEERMLAEGTHPELLQAEAKLMESVRRDREAIVVMEEVFFVSKIYIFWGI